MTVVDRPAALLTLSRISYYRLSGYWLPFKLRDDTFAPGTKFEAAVALYDFDRRLRLLMLDAVERAEIALRTQITYHLAHAHGTFAQTDPTSFRPEFDHARWYSEHLAEVQRAKERFIEHFKTEYEGFPRVPLWMASEVMSFGALSQMFKHLRPEIQDPIAASWRVHRRVATSWCHTITYVRNVCAHHGRLWNRELSIAPMLPKEAKWQAVRPKRAYAILCMLRHITASDHGDGWAESVRSLLRECEGFPDRRGGMGVPHDWATSEFWR